MAASARRRRSHSNHEPSYRALTTALPRLHGVLCRLSPGIDAAAATATGNIDRIDVAIHHVPVVAYCIQTGNRIPIRVKHLPVHIRRKRADSAVVYAIESRDIIWRLRQRHEIACLLSEIQVFADAAQVVVAINRLDESIRVDSNRRCERFERVSFIYTLALVLRKIALERLLRTWRLLVKRGEKACVEHHICFSHVLDGHRLEKQVVPAGILVNEPPSVLVHP